MLQQRVLPNRSSPNHFGKEKILKSNCVARALYDNLSESPDELCFRKGDLLTILEQNTNDLEGWWLCSIRGRQGIAPGNRLRIMPGIYDHTGLGFHPSQIQAQTQQENGARRRSWNDQQKVIIPQRIGDVYLYDSPPMSSQTVGVSRESAYPKHKPVLNHQESYDTPPSPQPLNKDDFEYDQPRSQSLPINALGGEGTTYDIPRPFPNHDYDLPSGSPDPQGDVHSTYDLPRSHQMVTSSDNYVVPMSHHLIMQQQKMSNSGPLYLGKNHHLNRSSGIASSYGSAMSSPSISPACSQTSLNVSLSLSSLAGNRSSIESQSEIYDYPVGEPKRVLNYSPMRLPASQSPSFPLNPPVPSQDERDSQTSVNSNINQAGLLNDYDMPPMCTRLVERPSLEKTANEDYDIPPPISRPALCAKSNINGLCQSQKNFMEINNPPYHKKTESATANLGCTFSDTYDTPISRPMLSAKSTSKGNVLDGVYDVPPQVTRDFSPEKSEFFEATNNHRSSVCSTDSLDGNKELPELAKLAGKELPIDLDAAMENLVNVHQEVSASITKLFSLVTLDWKKSDNLEHKVYDVKSTCQRLRASLNYFLAFARGSLANSIHAPDKTLCHKLAKLIRPLNDSQIIVQEAISSLEEKSWNLKKPCGLDDTSSIETPDELDQLVACGRGLVEDVRQVASFIQGNSSLIFKRSKMISESRNEHSSGGYSKPSVAPKPVNLYGTGGKQTPSNRLQERPLPSPPSLLATEPVDLPTKLDIPTSKDQVDSRQSPKPITAEEVIANDYDYVSLEPKELAHKKTLEQQETEVLSEEVPEKMSQKIILNVQEKKPVTDPSDLQLLNYYSHQFQSHLTFLTSSLDSFFTSIKTNQTPKSFVGHAKFVLIGADKILCIGDTIFRKIQRQEKIKKDMERYCCDLTQSMKMLVETTKTAANMFPSVEAVQKMVDSAVILAQNAKIIVDAVAYAAMD